MAAIGDYLRILRSGVFEHAEYARLHLGSRLLAPVAILHYLARGEAAGLRPTPFFDPEHRRRAIGNRAVGNLFADFLARDDDVGACAEFDAAWYRAADPDVKTSGLSAWWHWHRIGRRALRDPGPDLSIAFVLTAYHKKPKRLMRSLLELFERRRGRNGRRPPLSLAEHVANRDAFKASIAFEVVASREGRGHTDLVFVQTSGRHPKALHAEDRTYDLLLDYYCAPIEPPPPADHVVRQNGTKVTAIAEILRRCPDLLLRYERVLFLDDDIDIDAVRIGRFFEIMAEDGLDLAQPALSERSTTAFPVLARVDGSRLRHLDAVEIMMPALSRRALEVAAPIFDMGVSGYGVDLRIGLAVRERFGETVAIVDEVVGEHLTPVDREGGAYYTFLAAHGIDPLVELWVLTGEAGIRSAIREHRAG